MRVFPEVFGDQATCIFSEPPLDFALTGAQAELPVELRTDLSRQTGIVVPPVRLLRQVHGAHVLVAGTEPSSQQEADAWVTDRTGLALGIRTADCLPVYVLDPVCRCIGLVHAGWRGTRKEIVARVVAEMENRWGTRSTDLLVALGPCLRIDHYAVSLEFREFFPQHVIDRDGRMFLDLAGANRDQLCAAGVPREQIYDCQRCTFADQTCFSYRRQGPSAGRHLAVMFLNK